MTSSNPITERYAQELPFLRDALSAWEVDLKAEAREIDKTALISGRVKSLKSVLGKVYKHPGKPRDWDSLGDLVALKAIFPTSEAVEAFTTTLGGKIEWQPSLDRKTVNPSELKYVSNQFDMASATVVDSFGAPIRIEVQVRTASLDAWYMVDHRLRYKGSVELTPELERRMLRLIVLTELFDSEVDLMLTAIRDLPGYERAAVYDDLTAVLDELLPGGSRATRPAGLFETILEAYSDEELPDVASKVRAMASSKHDKLTSLILAHTQGSTQFLESRDWLYSEPEALLLAERAVARPAKLRNVIENSDFEPLLRVMTSEFSAMNDE